MESLKIKDCNYFYKQFHPQKQEAILCIHGHPFNHSMWQYQVQALENYRLIMPDLKGFGQTDHNYDKIFIEDTALELAILLDELNIDKVHVMGLSLGGQIAIAFARLFAHKTKSLIVCGALPFAETEESFKTRMAAANEIEEKGMLAYTQQHIAKYLHSNIMQHNKHVYHHLFEMMINTSTQGAAASHRGRALRLCNASFLQQIKIPVLFMIGDEDNFVDALKMSSLHQSIPNSSMVTIPQAGHLINMEQPQAFNAAVLQFLATT